MIAAEYREMAAVIGELACLDLLHPGAIHTQGHVMLRLARHRARMATDALASINARKGVLLVPNYTIVLAVLPLWTAPLGASSF